MGYGTGEYGASGYGEDQAVALTLAYYLSLFTSEYQRDRGGQIIAAIPGMLQGSGYVSGDIVTVLGGDGTAQLQVVAPIGVPVGYFIITPGNLYPSNIDLATTGGSGSGATVNLTTTPLYRLLAWAAAVYQLLIDAANLLAQEYVYFDLLVGATGVQLDVLGVVLGIGRTVPFIPSGGVSPVLDDATYRTLLQAKVLFNQWRGQIDTLYSAWGQLFPGGRITVIDNMDMTATISVGGTFTSIIQDLISNGYIIPRPQGVAYTITFVTLPMLGFDLDNAFIAGFDLGHWI